MRYLSFVGSLQTGNPKSGLGLMAVFKLNGAKFQRQWRDLISNGMSHDTITVCIKSTEGEEEGEKHAHSCLWARRVEQHK